MKTCPVCKIDYSDKAEFCKKCEALLIEKPETPEPVKPNYRGLIIACVSTLGFILFIMLIVFIYRTIV